MREAGIDWYLVPTSDYHDSEYVSEFFMVRKYFSGFTGSAGTLVVGQEEAVLFTDGRYFIQAEKELAGSGIRLMKTGEKDVPTLKEYLDFSLKEGQNLGFDGRVVKADDAKSYVEIVNKKKGETIWNRDIAGEVWEGRPSLVHHPVFVLEDAYSGEDALTKIARVREKMKKEGADMHILTALDDIAWLLNLRGADVACCPVVLAYAVITMEKTLLFGEGNTGGAEGWTAKVRQYLRENKVTLLPYDDFYRFVPRIQEKKYCSAEDVSATAC